MARYFYTAAKDEEKLSVEDTYYTMTRSNETDEFICLDYLEKTFKGFELEDYYYHYDEGMVELLSSFFYVKILWFTNPDFDEKAKTVSYFESLEKRERDIRTTSKVGKFIRKIAPYYNDKQVESLVDSILEAYKVPNYTYHVGNTPEDFAEVYTMRPESGRGIGNYKCINASCMRDKFGGQQHPCSVYGSGDFEIHYLLNEQGKIAARSILCTVDNVFAPIYASSKFAGKELERLLDEKGYTDCDDDECDSWAGAKLLKIKSDSGWLAPYIDVTQSVEEGEDYFFISHDTDDYNFCNTSGYVRRNCKCAKCGCSVNHYDIEMIDDVEYCASCVNYCDYVGEYTTEDTVKVYYARAEYYHHNYSLSAAQEHAVYDEENDKWYTREWNEERKKIVEYKKSEGVIKTGDVVRIIANSNNSRNKVGDIGIVSEGRPGWQEVVIPGRELQNPNGCYTEVEDMILYQFEVGDKVKVIGNRNTIRHFQEIGDVGTIIREQESSTHGKYFSVQFSDCSQCISPADLEVVLTVVTE